MLRPRVKRGRAIIKTFRGGGVIMARKPYEPKGKIATSKAMASMRETAFGTGSYFATKRVLEAAERLRDDDALLAAAEEKRLRKRLRAMVVKGEKT